MAPYGKPKGKDARIDNEGREKQKGMSKTEIQALMRRMSGAAESEVMPASPLMPNMKGGKRGPIG